MEIEKEISNMIFSSPAETARKLSNGKYKTPPHIRKLDELLVLAAFRKHRRLIINLPPRHGKSELISKYFPFWYLGNFPSHRVILTSYEATFAASWGRKVRDLVATEGQAAFGISLAEGAAAVQSFSLSSGGSMNTAGAGGAITGKGADLLIIDDPIKNDAEAASQTIRDNVWDWFVSTAYTRIEPNGIIIIIMTRWHEDDLCGRLETNFANDWHIVKIPAIAESDDPLGRQAGEALWKQRFPIETLLDIKHQIGSHWFAALYQQSPSPASGSIFKRHQFKYFSIDGDYFVLHSAIAKRYWRADCQTYCTIDPAISSGEKSDYTVALIFVLTPEREVLVLDVLRDRIDAATHLELIRNIYRRYKCKLIGIESVQYQTVLLRQARSEGLPVKELKADKDKFTRALPVAAMIEASRVFFLQETDWLGEFERELLAFPNGKHDDQTDALAYIPSLCLPATNSLPKGKTLRSGSFSDF